MGADSGFVEGVERQEPGYTHSGGDPPGGTMAEVEVQACWFAGNFGREFISSSGDAVRVVQFGTWNRLAGPDFVDAAVSINGGPPQAGAVELDLELLDWERHGHAMNSEYNAVVLHLFVKARPGERFFTRTFNHRNVPQVHLLQPIGGWVPGHNQLASPGRCASVLSGLSDSELSDRLMEAARVRFQRKVAAIKRTRDAHGTGEALYQALSAGLGYSGNELPFTLIAQRLPVALLTRSRGAVEALLFGVSGLIPGPCLARLTPEARQLARCLWEQWWPYRTGHGRSEIESGLWRLGRQRPLNHPQRRLAALSLIVKHWRTVLRLYQTRDWRNLRQLLVGLEHLFWSHQLTFQSASFGRKVRLLGPERVSDLLVNAFIPAAEDWPAFCGWKVSNFNIRCRIAAARLLPGRPGIGRLFRSAVLVQGLLELHDAFCRRDLSDCVGCPFPEQLADWQRRAGTGSDSGIDRSDGGANGLGVLGPSG